MPTPLNTFLLSLAVADLGVGLLVQPLHIARFTMELQPNAQENNPSYKIIFSVYLVLVNLFYSASFFGVTALTVDRFLAIHLHLRYQELAIVTHKRVVAVVILMWAFSASLSLIALLVPALKDNLIVFVTIEVFCLITVALCFATIQDLFGSTTPRKSNAYPASTARSSEWRNGKYWKAEKICRRQILSV